MKLNRSLRDCIDGVDAFLNFSFRDVREQDKNTLTRMKLNRSLRDCIDGVDAFLNFSFRDVREQDKNTLTIRCPYDKC